MSLSPITRLTLVVPALLALAGALARVDPDRPIRVGSPLQTAALEKRAEAYLRQTAQILGTRFHEDFYRSAVQTLLSRPLTPTTRKEASSRECFALLDAGQDAGLAEALAFLDEIERGKVSLPTDVFYAKGCPANAFADRLAFGPVRLSFSARVGLWTEAAMPFSGWLGVFLSLIALPAASLPTSPLGAVAGAGAAALHEFFDRLANRLFFLVLSLSAILSAVRIGGYPFLAHTTIDEKKITVLRC